MSKKVSELEELLKFLGASSLSDIRLVMAGTCGTYNHYTLGIYKLLGTDSYTDSNPISAYTALCIIKNNKFVPVPILYNNPDNITSENEYEYTETFNYSKCTFGNQLSPAWSRTLLLITDDILKQLDNNVTVITALTCD